MLDWIDCISSLSNREYIEIVATFQVLHDSTYQCNQCTKRVPSQKTRDEKKGCSKELDKPFASWRDLIKFKKCPATFYSGYWASVIDNFRQYDKGVLPYQGSLLDQPNKIIEAYNLIESLKIEYESELMEKQAKAQKRIAEKWQTKSKYR